MTKQNKRRSFDRFRGRVRDIQPGQAPGTLVADPEAPKSVIQFFGSAPDSKPENFIEQRIDDPALLPALMEKWSTSWINVIGLGDLKTIQTLGEMFNIHRLALEDVLNVSQRPKAEEFENLLFVIARYNAWQEILHSEQISIFVGKGFVLSFQEREGDCFDGVRDRLRKGKGRIRSSCDYLAYALLDSIVDHNFPLLEGYGDRLEKLEEEAISSPNDDTVARIYKIKRDLAAIRRTVWPLRDMLVTLLRDDTDYFKGEIALFLRDCYDHVLQVADLIEHYRDVASELINVCMSAVSNRMNEVMRLLTLIATIFIPLGFIAGLYGMNFDTEFSPWNMPELAWRFGYLFALGVMAAVAIGMVIYFWKKGWIGKSSNK